MVVPAARSLPSLRHLCAASARAGDRASRGVARPLVAAGPVVVTGPATALSSRALSTRCVVRSFWRPRSRFPAERASGNRSGTGAGCPSTVALTMAANGCTHPMSGRSSRAVTQMSVSATEPTSKNARAWTADTSEHARYDACSATPRHLSEHGV